MAACEAPPDPGIFPTSAELYAEAHARFDPDRDGVITPVEYQAFDPNPAGFGALDVNQDGGVSATELEAFVDARQPRALVSRRAGKDGPGPPRGAGPNSQFQPGVPGQPGLPPRPPPPGSGVPGGAFRPVAPTGPPGGALPAPDAPK